MSTYTQEPVILSLYIATDADRRDHALYLEHKERIDRKLFLHERLRVMKIRNRDNRYDEDIKYLYKQLQLMIFNDDHRDKFIAHTKDEIKRNCIRKKWGFEFFLVKGEYNTGINIDVTLYDKELSKLGFRITKFVANPGQRGYSVV